MRKSGLKMRMAVGLVSAVAMLGASAAPAMARNYGNHGGYRGGYGYPGGYYGGYGYGRHYRHYRHRDRLDAGEVIGIAALIGAVAVIASAASKEKKSRSEPYPRSSEPRYDDRRYDDRRDDYGDARSEDEAVNACASAARDKAERDGGGYAEIVDVERPRASGTNGWDVEGRLEQRRNYQDKSGTTKRFSCDVQGGRVAHVYVTDSAA